MSYVNTKIITNFNNGKYLSSIYRNFGNGYFQQEAWETFMWEGSRIVKEYPTFIRVEDVLKLHENESKSYIDI